MSVGQQEKDPAAAPPHAIRNAGGVSHAIQPGLSCQPPASCEPSLFLHHNPEFPFFLRHGEARHAFLPVKGNSDPAGADLQVGQADGVEPDRQSWIVNEKNIVRRVGGQAQN